METSYRNLRGWNTPYDALLTLYGNARDDTGDASVVMGRQESGDLLKRYRRLSEALQRQYDEPVQQYTTR
jgi:hypothetical protein